MLKEEMIAGRGGARLSTPTQLCKPILVHIINTNKKRLRDGSVVRALPALAEDLDQFPASTQQLNHPTL